MPYVNIKVTREGSAPEATATTLEQKKALVKGDITTPEFRQQLAASAQSGWC